MAEHSMLVLLLLLPLSHAGRDNQGTEFIMCFMDNQIKSGQTGNDVELFITTMSNIDANVNVTLPLFDPTYLETAVVARNNIVKITVSHTIRMVSTMLGNNGIWIQSDQEIIVFGVNKETHSTDAYQALPVDVWGTDYYVMTYVNDAEIGIVASEDSTDVTVVLPNSQIGTLGVSYNGATYTNGDTMTFTLNRYETFQVFDGGSTADFTGAHITATKPIGVLGGNKKIKIPYTGSGSSDHLTEQIPPVETLGRQFYTYSTPDRSVGDLIRVMAVEDATTVTLSNGTAYSISLAGEFVEYDVSTGSYFNIESDKGVIVGLFSKTHKGSSDGANGGDPAMTFLLPRPQWAADYTYATVRTPTNTEFVNQIVVHVDPNEVDGLQLDQTNMTGVTWEAVTGVTDIVVGVIDVSDGTHNIYHIDPTVVFSAISTGVANFNSYAFATGTRMATINTVCVPSSTSAGDIIDNDCDMKIDEETLNGIDDDGDGQIDEDLATPPRVEGNWGAWTSWSNCSETCEAIGNQTRSRNCDNPAPANNGMDCAGNDTEVINCDVTAIDCYLDGNWTAWTTWDNCTGSCGWGTQFRDRNCTNPIPKGGGNYCSGDHNETTTCQLTVACAAASEDNTALIAGATVGALAAAAAAAACCCLLFPAARKKIFGDDDEEEEPLPPEDGVATARGVGIGGLDNSASGPGAAPAGTGINRVSPMR